MAQPQLRRSARNPKENIASDMLKSQGKQFGRVSITRKLIENYPTGSRSTSSAIVYTPPRQNSKR